MAAARLHPARALRARQRQISVFRADIEPQACVPARFRACGCGCVRGCRCVTGAGVLRCGVLRCRCRGGGPDQKKEHKKSVGRSPEQVLQNAQYSTEIDIWAIGCIFFKLLSGRTLFKGPLCRRACV